MKYVELAKQYNGEQKMDDRIEESASILKDKLEAKIAMQKAYITEQKSKVRAAEKAAIKAKATLTEDIDLYLATVFTALDQLEDERDRLSNKTAVLDDLMELSGLF